MIIILFAVEAMVDVVEAEVEEEEVVAWEEVAEMEGLVVGMGEGAVEENLICQEKI